MSGASPCAIAIADEVAQTEISLALILTNSALEINRLSSLVRLVEDAVLDLASVEKISAVNSKSDLLNLDFILQNLVEISGVLARSSAVLLESSELQVKREAILGPVKLAKLRHALARTSEALPVIGSDSEKVEFF